MDNFLLYTEQYFQAMRVTNGAVRVSTMAMYLSDNVLLWWRCRSDDKSGEPITT